LLLCLVMKLLNGAELAGFIKKRQAEDVDQLWRIDGIRPKLAIIQCIDDPVINTYVRLKKSYGRDVGIEVQHYQTTQSKIAKLLQKLNSDQSIHGIIVQLPLVNPDETETIVNLVSPEKDVDALGSKSVFDPATPMAILWLLAGYNIELAGKRILLIGRGKLVGAPLEKILTKSGYNVTVVAREVERLIDYTLGADVIITATGSPAILYSNMIKEGAIIVDAGVASEAGKTVGDVAEDVYKRDDITITPAKGGVGPLTVCALFENVIRATRYISSKREK